MRHRVHAARRRDARRQRERQVGIVDRGQRQAVVVVAGHAVLAGADRPGRRHFRAGIGRDHRDRPQAGIGGDGLGEADRRATADHQDAVGVLLLGMVDELGEALARIAGRRQLMDVGDAAGACDCTRSAVGRLEVVQRISARERLCSSSSAGTDWTRAAAEQHADGLRLEDKVLGHARSSVARVLLARLDRPEAKSHCRLTS